LLNDSGDGADPQAAEEKREQRAIRERINAMADRISQSKDTFVISRIEQEIRALSSRIVLEENEVFNVDTVVKEAKEKRRTDRVSGAGNGMNWQKRQANASWNGTASSSSWNGGASFNQRRF
jgi:hypothetical protein